MFDEGEKGEIPAEEILEVERNVEYRKNKFSKKKKKVMPYYPFSKDTFQN